MVRALVPASSRSREIARWLTHVELIMVGRFDLATDDDVMRRMLRTFPAPAFLSSPVPAA